MLMGGPEISRLYLGGRIEPVLTAVWGVRCWVPGMLLFALLASI